MDGARGKVRVRIGERRDQNAALGHRRQDVRIRRYGSAHRDERVVFGERPRELYGRPAWFPKDVPPTRRVFRCPRELHLAKQVVFEIAFVVGVKGG